MLYNASLSATRFLLFCQTGRNIRNLPAACCTVLMVYTRSSSNILKERRTARQPDEYNEGFTQFYIHVPTNGNHSPTTYCPTITRERHGEQASNSKGTFQAYPVTVYKLGYMTNNDGRLRFVIQVRYLQFHRIHCHVFLNDAMHTCSGGSRNRWWRKMWSKPRGGVWGGGCAPSQNFQFWTSKWPVSVHCGCRWGNASPSYSPGSATAHV